MSLGDFIFGAASTLTAVGAIVATHKAYGTISDRRDTIYFATTPIQTDASRLSKTEKIEPLAERKFQEIIERHRVRAEEALEPEPLLPFYLKGPWRKYKAAAEALQEQIKRLDPSFKGYLKSRSDKPTSPQQHQYPTPNHN